MTFIGVNQLLETLFTTLFNHYTYTFCLDVSKSSSEDVLYVGKGYLCLCCLRLFETFSDQSKMLGFLFDAIHDLLFF